MREGPVHKGDHQNDLFRDAVDTSFSSFVKLWRAEPPGNIHEEGRKEVGF